jgi:hypothetical protein
MIAFDTENVSETQLESGEIDNQKISGVHLCPEGISKHCEETGIVS